MSKMGQCTSVQKDMEEIEARLQMATNLVDVLEYEKKKAGRKVKKLKNEISKRDKELSNLLDDYDALRETLHNLRRVFSSQELDREERGRIASATNGDVLSLDSRGEGSKELSRCTA